jgi:hypothetical protein
VARISTDGSIVVNAPVDVCVAAIKDIVGEGEWIKELKSIEAVEHYDDGLVKKAKLTVDIVKLGSDTYFNEYEYGPNEMRYRTTESSLQKEQFGAYKVKDNGDGTSTFSVEITVEARVPTPAFVLKPITNTVMKGTLTAFKEWVETSRV